MVSLKHRNARNTGRVKYRASDRELRSDRHYKLHNCYKCPNHKTLANSIQGISLGIQYTKSSFICITKMAI